MSVLKEFDEDVIHVIPAGQSVDVNFQYRSGTVGGGPAVTKLYRVKIVAVQGRFQVQAAWPGMRAPFTMVFDAGDTHRFTQLLDPWLVDSASKITLVDLPDAPQGTSSSSAPDVESQAKIIFVGT